MYKFALRCPRRNCLISALLSSRGEFRLVASRLAVETIRCLGQPSPGQGSNAGPRMPKFKLTRDEQQMQLGEFLLYAEIVRFETTADGVREFPRLVCPMGAVRRDA